MSQRTIRTLLVDDAADHRALMRVTLEPAGRFEIVGEAENGAEAVEIAEELQPDLVVLDVSMPVQDGMESLPELVRVAPSAKVVMLSAFEARRLEGTALARGAAAYLEKSLEPDRLVEELLAVVG